MTKNKNIIFIKTLKLIHKLQEKFPATFSKKPLPKVPLSIGIYHDLIKISNELDTNKYFIRKALKMWCNTMRYYIALSEEGAARIDLNGNKKGIVTKEESDFAYKNLLNILEMQKKPQEIKS